MYYKIYIYISLYIIYINIYIKYIQNCDQRVIVHNTLIANAIRMKSSTRYKCENHYIIQLDRYSFAINNNISSYNNLKELLLNDNTLTKLHCEQFIDLTELSYINLKHNRLKVMGPDIFKYNTKLTNIDISYNQIESFNVVIDDLPSLRILRMEHNIVKTLEEHIFKEYIYGNGSKRNTLNIDNNKLDCGCLMYWILEIHKKGYYIKAKMSKDGMCKGLLNPRVSLECFYVNRDIPMPCDKINRTYCTYG